MLSLKQLTLLSGLILALLSTAAAQESNLALHGSSLTITAAVSDERMRFTAPSTIVEMHVQVYDNLGQLIAEVTSEGNVLDWSPLDKAGARLGNGSYLTVVTVKSLSGKPSRRLASMLVAEKQYELQPLEATQLTLAQVQAVGPIEENAALTVLKAGQAEASTAIAHNGTDGQMIRSRGAFSFRTGDFFSGRDQEQMRLTEEGNLGIGTSKPQFKLDVEGAIRARGGFVFTDGSTLNVNEKGVLTRTASDGSITPNVAGTGTQDKLAKWTDNAGTLGDSGITESAGLIGIGTTNPTVKLDVQNTGGNGSIRSVNETFGVRGVISEQHSSNVVGAVFVGLKSRGTLAAPSAVVPGDFGGFFSNKWFDGSSYVQSGAFGVTVDGPVSAGVVPTRLSFVTSTTSGDGPTAHGVERMTISSGGNVGIGTNTPNAKLDVAGDINVTGNAVIGGNIAAKYQDVAEWVQARKPLAPGTLVILDARLANAVVASDRAYDTRVAGVISARPGVILGEAGAGKVLVATTGRVRLKVDATRNPIKIGDLLVASEKTGVAMKSLPIMVRGVRIHRPGTIIGKALEPLATGAGEILVLLSLQ